MIKKLGIGVLIAVGGVFASILATGYDYYRRQMNEEG